MLAPFGHARLLFSKSHHGKGANGSKNRPHDAYPVRKKYRQLKNWPTYGGVTEPMMGLRVLSTLRRFDDSQHPIWFPMTATGGRARI